MSKLNLFQKKYPLRLENFVCDLESMLTGILDVQSGTSQWFLFFFLDFDNIIKFGKHKLGTKKKKSGLKMVIGAILIAESKGVHRCNVAR
jgi:hypothetical protein